MKQLFFSLILFFAHALLYSQQDKASEYTGIYSDWGTELEIRDDFTFRLNTVDYVYPNTYQDYENEGIWVKDGKEIILNPAYKKRIPTLQLKEKSLGSSDSITIKINHYNQIYENQKLIETKPLIFEMVTLYFNKRKKYHNITRSTMQEGTCAFAPRIKKRINVDSTNTFTIAKKEIEKIGVFTYGFSNFIELDVTNKNSNYFEIDITMPIDKERMPRSKRVRISKSMALYYETRKGNLDLWAMPLKKKK